MKKYIPSFIIIVISLFFILTALFSENCFPRIVESECFLRKDGENLVFLGIGLGALLGGLVKLRKAGGGKIKIMNKEQKVKKYVTFVD